MEDFLNKSCFHDNELYLQDPLSVVCGEVCRLHLLLITPGQKVKEEKPQDQELQKKLCSAQAVKIRGLENV